MKIIPIILSVLLMSSVYAGEDDSKFQKGEFLKKELNLTDEQLEKVKEIRKADRDELRDNRKEFRTLKKEFREAMDNPKASTKDLTAKFEAFQKARDEFQRKRFQKMLKMREILSPDQLKKFKELHKKKRGKWKKKKDRKNS